MQTAIGELVPGSPCGHGTADVDRRGHVSASLSADHAHAWMTRWLHEHPDATQQCADAVYQRARHGESASEIYVRNPPSTRPCAPGCRGGSLLAMSLQAEIDAKRLEIHTEGYPMSVGELLNLYRDDELDIHPEFQRFFRWSDSQKSRFIESLLLGIPVPSIFVNQRHDGVWDVIDGLQRLSTIFEFVGYSSEKTAQLSPL